jgi:hypothetical protein
LLRDVHSNLDLAPESPEAGRLAARAGRIFTTARGCWSERVLTVSTTTSMRRPTRRTTRSFVGYTKRSVATGASCASLMRPIVGNNVALDVDHPAVSCS